MSGFLSLKSSNPSTNFFFPLPLPKEVSLKVNKHFQLFHTDSRVRFLGKQVQIQSAGLLDLVEKESTYCLMGDDEYACWHLQRLNSPTAKAIMARWQRREGTLSQSKSHACSNLKQPIRAGQICHYPLYKLWIF